MLSLNLGDDDSREKDIDFNGNDLIMGRQLHSAVSTSPLLAAVVRKHTDVCTLQYARELNICSLQIQVQDWVFLRDGRSAVIAQVSQMALIRRSNQQHSEVYFWCCHCHAASQLLEDPDALMRIHKDNVRAKRNVLVLLSCVSISTLVCENRQDHLEFRYVF